MQNITTLKKNNMIKFMKPIHTYFKAHCGVEKMIGHVKQS